MVRTAARGVTSVESFQLAGTLASAGAKTTSETSGPNPMSTALHLQSKTISVLPHSVLSVAERNHYTPGLLEEDVAIKLMQVQTFGAQSLGAMKHRSVFLHCRSLLPMEEEIV